MLHVAGMAWSPWPSTYFKTRHFGRNQIQAAWCVWASARERQYFLSANWEEHTASMGNHWLGDVLTRSEGLPFLLVTDDERLAAFRFRPWQETFESGLPFSSNYSYLKAGPSLALLFIPDVFGGPYNAPFSAPDLSGLSDRNTETTLVAASTTVFGKATFSSGSLWRLSTDGGGRAIPSNIIRLQCDDLWLSASTFVIV